MNAQNRLSTLLAARKARVQRAKKPFFQTTTWHLRGTNNGDALVLTRLDRNAAFRQHVEMFVAKHLCGHDLGEWSWKVPVGRPRYDHDELIDGKPYLTNSLASTLIRIEGRVYVWSEKAAGIYEVAAIPLTVDQRRVIELGMGWMSLADYLDEAEEGDDA